ncbi:MAG: alanyl-tRNA editing protein, partial [Chloroflexota bacterium]
MLKSRIMGERSYYTDSYTSEFPARVVETQQTEGAFAVVLDRSYFYPTSGGQPNDTGTIDGIPVIDVQVRKEDGAILHMVESLPQSEEVTAAIDWRRRFDHMQQHTGQHILSQAFIQTHGAQTIGFHLSDETATIDLDVNKIDQEAINKAEDLANRVVWQNRPVVVRWATRQEAERLPLRKIPENGGEKLRLIDIVNFDLTACGGTH